MTTHTHAHPRISRDARTGGRLAALLAAIALLAVPAGCDDDDGNADAVTEKLIRGRVTDVDGLPVGELEVLAEGRTARTDADGRFEIAIEAEGEVRVSVESREFSAAELPVRLERDAPANVEVSVKPRRTLMLPDAAQGGRVEGQDGLAVELPADALRFRDDRPVTGEVEVRYALVNRSRDVVAAPGRMQAADRGGLDGFGMAEVRFYQDGERLRLAKEMEVEVPLYDGHPLRDGDEVELYELGEGDLRWQRSKTAMVAQDKVRIRTQRDEWLGAAEPQPTDACVKGSLSTASEPEVTNTTIRAARARGLSLIQAESGSDGSFCLPVTPDDDWSVSTFYTDGDKAWGIEVELTSDEAAGMCGGDSGCKDVGAVELPRIERL